MTNRQSKQYCEVSYLMGTLSILFFLVSFNIKNIRITYTDLLFCTYIIYLSAQMHDSKPYSSDISLLLIHLLVYLCFRNLYAYKTAILHIISFIGLIQAVNGILQYCFFVKFQPHLLCRTRQFLQSGSLRMFFMPYLNLYGWSLFHQTAPYRENYY